MLSLPPDVGLAEHDRCFFVAEAYIENLSKARGATLSEGVVMSLIVCLMGSWFGFV
jgi:hypothetical protein